MSCVFPLQCGCCFFLVECDPSGREQRTLMSGPFKTGIIVVCIILRATIPSGYEKWQYLFEFCSGGVVFFAGRKFHEARKITSVRVRFVHIHRKKKMYCLVRCNFSDFICNETIVRNSTRKIHGYTAHASDNVSNILISQLTVV